MAYRSLTVEQKFEGIQAQYLQLISLADQNGDHLISLEEYLAYTQLQYLKFDENHDGRLSFEQYRSAVFAQLERQSEVNPLLKERLPNLKRSFDQRKKLIIAMIDKMGDGFLTIEALQAEQKSSFSRLDLNQDGHIDLSDLNELKKQLNRENEKN